MTKPLRIIHFCDVYNFNAKERGDVCGGAARFVELVRSYREGGSRYVDGLQPLVFFSGDAFFPSVASQITLGKHMVPVLNAIGIDCSTQGNHEFDSGCHIAAKLIGQLNHPWLLANVKLRADNGGAPTPLVAGTKESIIIEHNGIKIGLIGLAEKNWIDTLSCVEPEDVIYEDFVECARRIAPQLREQEGAQIVIALTHMRVPRDKRLAEEAGDVIDLILGGHDHDYQTHIVPPHNIHIVKSGTDFHDLTVVDLKIHTQQQEQQQRPLVVEKLERVRVVRSMPECPDMVKTLSVYEEAMKQRMTKVIGHTAVPLDARFASIRTSETNVSNMVASCVRWNVRPKPDIVLFNAGTLRTDAIIPAGPFTIGDLMALLPMLDPLVVLNISGEQLISALENGVSQVPAHEGRFPCVSGVRFKFDPLMPPGKRVLADTVKVNGHRLDLRKMYTLCTKEYISTGRDGYTVFQDCSVAVDSEDMTSLATAVQRFFLCQSIAMKFARAGAFHNAVQQQVQTAVEKFKAGVENDNKDNDETTKVDSKDNKNENAVEEEEEEEEEQSFDKTSFYLAPKIEGRIVAVPGGAKMTMEISKSCSEMALA